MKVRCPDCGSRGVLNAELAGRMARCSRCGAKFVATEDFSSDEGLKWYYAEGDQKKGPFAEEEFALLISGGTIAPETLVWRKGMRDWQTLAMTRGEETVFIPHAEPAPAHGSAPESRASLDEKGVPKEALAHSSVRMAYAGGVKRLIAKGIDLIFMFTIATLIDGLSQRLFPAAQGADGISKVYLITMLIDMLLGMVYITGFVGKFGATPGKMVFSLKVVTPTGGRVGYGRAFARYWAEFVVIWLTLMLGYLPILFDPQRRGLHDRLCNTRVVRV